MLAEQLKDLKEKQFREQAEKQREKIKNLKDKEDLVALQEQSMNRSESKASVASKPKSTAASRKAKKPAWALTEKQQVEEAVKKEEE